MVCIGKVQRKHFVCLLLYWKVVLFIFMYHFTLFFFFFLFSFHYFFDRCYFFEIELVFVINCNCKCNSFSFDVWAPIVTEIAGCVAESRIWAEMAIAQGDIHIHEHANPSFAYLEERRPVSKSLGRLIERHEWFFFSIRFFIDAFFIHYYF